MSSQLNHLLIRVPRDSEATPEASVAFLSTLINLNPQSFLDSLSNKNLSPLALEIVLFNQQIHFQITADEKNIDFIQTQIRSSYPLAIIEKLNSDIIANNNLETVELELKNGNYYPLATYDNFQDIDPITSFLTVLATGDPNDIAIIQFALLSTSSRWQNQAIQYAQYGTKNADGTFTAHPDSALIKEKANYPGFRAEFRLASNSKKILTELLSTIQIFSRPNSNSLVKKKKPLLSNYDPYKSLLQRRVSSKQILNIAEIATIWHLPGIKVKTPSIAWGATVLSEAPENLPIAENLSGEEKEKINFFAKTQFKNTDMVFGIKDKDRLRHIWTIGKTGTGKSTMIANMAIDDLKKGRGLGVIDPHGDLCDDILDYIPSDRINDTVYFNPADRDFPIAINPLEVTRPEEAELVVSGLMAIFTKVWANVWSARMEYILRNSFMTLVNVENSTFSDVLRIMSDQKFRNNILSKVEDKDLIAFWKEEFDLMPPALQKEAIAPIQNKVGQFITSPLIRRIINNPKSSISVEEIMDGKQIFLANLSQGRLGEDNAALLGAMLITKFQVAAMRRVDKPKDERVPFYLYVDEFQNFATSSFIKILSEARKYGLALTLANQYMAQIPTDVQKSILGNAGTIISFGVGAEDASIIHKEFAEVLSENDLVNLKNFQIAIKLMVDWHSARPFLANTLPLPTNKNTNREKVLRISRERWGKK